MGCGNKKFVEIGDLVEDEELGLRLARQRKHQQKR